MNIIFFMAEWYSTVCTEYTPVEAHDGLHILTTVANAALTLATKWLVLSFFEIINYE